MITIFILPPLLIKVANPTESKLIAEELKYPNNKLNSLLLFKKIFKSLKEHKFEYTISSEGEQNTVEIIYPIVINDTEQKEGQVLDFYKYTHHQT